MSLQAKTCLLQPDFVNKKTTTNLVNDSQIAKATQPRPHSKVQINVKRNFMIRDSMFMEAIVEMRIKSNQSNTVAALA